MTDYGDITWKQAAERLRSVYRDDLAFVEAGLNKDRVEARATAAWLYVRYMMTSNELTACHDSIIQPQIRVLIKKMLMCAFGRIVELKQILIGEDSSIYTPISDVLENLKVTYDKFELRIPRYFRDERKSFLDQIDSEIDAIHKRIEKENDDSNEIKEEIDEAKEVKEVKEDEYNSRQLITQESSESDIDLDILMKSEEKMPQKFRKRTDEDIAKEAALIFLQKHIRAAKDRVLANELLADKRGRANIISGKYIMPSKEKAHEAATKIQRYWRIYRIIRRTKIRTEIQDTLLGLHMSSDRPTMNIECESDEEIRQLQNEAANMFRKTVDKIQKTLNQRYKDDMLEEIEDELRSYVWTYFETCKHLPTWPDQKPIMFTNDDVLGLPPVVLPENILKKLKIQKIRYKSALNQQIPLGGSAIFHTGRWMTIEMAEILATTIVDFENKPAGAKAKLIKTMAKNEKKENEKILQIEKNKTLIREEQRALGFVPEPSNLTEWFQKTFYEFDSDWTIDDGLNERLREDLIKTDIFAKAQIELREIADENIKNELLRLKIAFARDLGKKYKPPNNKVTKTSKKKPSKSKVKKNDLLNPKEILEELVRNNMIKKSTTCKFNEFQGEVFLSANRLRGAPFYLDPPYGLGDVVQIIKELYVIGFVFPELRTLKQIKFGTSLLIAGPEKSGKTMLTNAICTETGSLKIKLTLENVSESYPDVEDKNRLVNIIVKFVTTYQPVVIEIDLADIPFYKKIPANLKMYNPKLFANFLKKLLKSFNKTDRVLIVGKAESPWLTASKNLLSVFQNIVFTVPDYNSTYLFLNNLLMSYPAINRSFPVTSLATVLASYPRHVVASIVAEVMTTERVLTLRHKPLDPMEFIPVMVKYPKPNPELCEQYHGWYRGNVPLGVKRNKKLTEARTMKPSMQSGAK